MSLISFSGAGLLSALLLAYGSAVTALLPHLLYPFDSTPFQRPGLIEREVSHPQGPIPVAILPGAGHSLSEASVVFYLQGNAGSRAWFTGPLEAYRAAGYTTVTMAYPGAETRSGPVSEARLKSEALAVMQAIQGLVGASNPVIHIHGFSLGTGIAAHVAAHADPDSLVLQAGYHDLCSLVFRKSGFPACQTPWLDQWRTERHAAALDMPVLLLHGLRDRIIPPRYGKTLSLRLLEAGHFPAVVTYADTGHNDFGRRDTHMTDILRFLEDPRRVSRVRTPGDLDRLFDTSGVPDPHVRTGR